MALGIVIDDAANDVRHIRRRLREHRVASTETTSKSTVAVVLEAALERRSAIGYATLIALVAVVPVFLLTGLAGAFSNHWCSPMWLPWWHRPWSH